MQNREEMQKGHNRSQKTMCCKRGGISFLERGRNKYSFLKSLIPTQIAVFTVVFVYIRFSVFLLGEIIIHILKTEVHLFIAIPFVLQIFRFSKPTGRWTQFFLSTTG
jgi:hypothetical protein